MRHRQGSQASGGGGSKCGLRQSEGRLRGGVGETEAAGSKGWAEMPLIAIGNTGIGKEDRDFIWKKIPWQYDDRVYLIEVPSGRTVFRKQ